MPETHPLQPSQGLLGPGGPAPLLGWQTLLLAYALGALGAAHAIPALMGLVLLAALDWPRLAAGRRGPALLLCFTLGLGAGWISLPPAPPATPQAILDAKGKIRVQGRVASVEGRPSQRLNIQLENVVCRVPNDTHDDAYTDIALPAALLWTLEKPAFWPEPGAVVEAVMTVTPLHTYANPGGWDYAAYLARAGVFYRGYGASDKAPPRLLAPGDAPLWRWRQQMRDATLAALGGQEQLSPGRGLLMAFLYGDRFLLDQRTLDLMQRASLSHTLALSGQNLGYVVLSAWLLAWLAGLFWPGLYLRVARPKLVVLVAAPLVTVYLWLGGSPPSLLRAYVMFVFWGALLWRGRGRVLMDGLFQALLCMLVIQPGLVFDLGLQLSAGAVAGLALYLDCKPLLQAQANALQARLAAWFDVARFLDTDARRQRRLVRELEKDRRRDGPRAAQPNRFLASLPRLMLRVGIDLFCLSLAAQLAILPLIVWSFNQLSPQFYLNVLWLPFQGVLVQPLGMVGMCLLGFGPAVAGPFLAWAADLLDAGVWVLAWLNARNWLEPFIPLRPDWPAWIGYWTLLTWGLLLMRHNGVRRNAARPALALLPAIGLALLAWPTLEKTIEQAAGGVTLTLLDVGQGQSIVLEYPYGRRLLLDGGGLKSANFDVGASIVLPFLTLRSPPRLDLVALSHPDFDHSRGLLYLLRVADARAFASNGIPADSKEMRTLFAMLERRRIPSQVLTAGQRIMLSPGLALVALHPPAGYAPENTNNGSLVLRLVWNGVGLALLPGDAGNSALDLILRRVVSGSSEGEELTAQALVLPHHGSGKELREDLYARVGPRLALASAGYRNQWGFPTQTVREALAARGVPLAVTAENGALTVRWSAPERFSFETARREPRDPLFSFE